MCLAWSRDTFSGRVLEMVFPEEAEDYSPVRNLSISLSRTRQGYPTVSGMTARCHCPAAQGRRVDAVLTAQPRSVSGGSCCGLAV